MGAIFDIHNYAKPCCVISYFMFRNISQIVSAVLGAVSMSEGQYARCSRRLTRALVVWLRGLLYGSHPRLYSHKLVTFILFKSEIVFLLFLFLLFFDLLFTRPGNI